MNLSTPISRSVRPAGRGVASKVINCDDGVVIRAETDAELVANATAYLREAHPDRVGQVSAQDLLAQAVEV